jgi:hypothetical protein
VRYSGHRVSLLEIIGLQYNQTELDPFNVKRGRTEGLDVGLLFQATPLFKNKWDSIFPCFLDHSFPFRKEEGMNGSKRWGGGLDK